MIASTLRAVDLFCGAGGSTEGAEQSGRVKVVLAINHWRTAIDSHTKNHPGTRHICARIDHVDPRNDKSLPEFDLLMASPECTHHSVARGAAPVNDQKRATPWHVIIWAEACRPTWIVVENVREFKDWGPTKNGRPTKEGKGSTFDAWIGALRSLGYTVEWKLLNAADYGEATKRVRLFVIARLGPATIPWPKPSHAGRWRAAKEIIDWTRPCPSVFTRKRPLADKTLKRIEMGLRKFVGNSAADQFIVHFRGTGTVADVNDPLNAITAGGTHLGIATPFLHQFHNGADGERRTYDVNDPIPTLDTQPRYAITMPFQYQLIGNGAGRSRSINDPLPTQVAARENHGVVVPYLFDVNHGGNDGRTKDPRDPLGTITTKRGTGLAMPFMVDIHDRRRDDRTSSASEPLPTIVTKPGNSIAIPFLTQFNGTGGAESIYDPLTTCTTKPRHGLAMVSLLKAMQELKVCDVGFRMLDVDELSRAQGFPEGYELSGNKADQIRQVGNAVCPGVMRAICESITS
jgi:DNA (cytosine-5)-methyltransferase 1